MFITRQKMWYETAVKYFESVHKCVTNWNENMLVKISPKFKL